jgi:hypothetical protein
VVTEKGRWPSSNNGNGRWEMLFPNVIPVMCWTTDHQRGVKGVGRLCLIIIRNFSNRKYKQEVLGRINTILSLIWHWMHRKHVQQFFYCCVFVAAVMLLPSHCLAMTGGIHIQTHRLVGGIFEVCCWDGLRCRDIHTRFHRNCFMHSEVNREGSTDAQIAWRSHKPTLDKQAKNTNSGNQYT